MLIDSHAHLNFKAFAADLPEVIKRCQGRKMKVINVGSQLETSQKAVEIADNFDGFFASVGIHPIHLGKNQRDELETGDYEELKEKSLTEIFNGIKKLAKNKKVVAIGETGFDYFRLTGQAGEAARQKEYFLKHLDLARENDLPVILHCRGKKDNPDAAYEEILAMIKNKNLRGVIHCFGSNPAIAKKFVDLDFYIGITGIITFGKKAQELKEVAKSIPLDKILIETDCPYLAPEPYRGQRNEPIYVEMVAKKIAELKNVSLDEVVETTGKNAEQLFNI